MGRFDRYVLAQLMSVFGLAALVLVLVYWINRAVRLFDQIIASGESATVFLELSILTLPNVILLVLPVAAFAATVYVTNRLSTESELIIVQSTGFSPWRLARPVLTFGVIAAVFVSILAHVLVPASLARLGDRQAEIAENVTARLLTEGRFLHPAPGVTFYVGRITPEGALRSIFLSDSRDEELRLTYSAREALLVRTPLGPRLVMFDGLVQTYARDTARLSVTRFDDFAFDIGALLDTPVAGPRRLRERFTTELLPPAPGVLDAPGATLPRVLMEAHGRFTAALLTIFAPLLGFATLLLGGYSRFGIWRQILSAIAVIVLLQSLGNVVADVALADATLWPIHYLPMALAVVLTAILLWISAHPNALRRRRAAA